jgi:hypothetical protein
MAARQGAPYNHVPVFSKTASFPESSTRQGATMRILNILSGVAVLLTTLHLGHALHHFYAYASHQDVQSPFFWAGMAMAGAVGILSLIGGCLLLGRGR